MLHSKVLEHCAGCCRGLCWSLLWAQAGMVAEARRGFCGPCGRAAAERPRMHGHVTCLSAYSAGCTVMSAAVCIAHALSASN